MSRMLIAAALVLGLAGSAAAQGQVEIRTTPGEERRFEVVAPGVDIRSEGKPREADFYKDDVLLRHDPAFIEPLTGKTEAGNTYGFSGWTAPATPVGSLGTHAPWNGAGWFALGFTFTWDSPPPRIQRPAGRR